MKPRTAALASRAAVHAPAATKSASKVTNLEDDRGRTRLQESAAAGPVISGERRSRTGLSMM
ncbi:hypothetical protein ACU639_35230 [Streptomyces cynarae]|uniref:hypothetical protein n=1 Tax=Streptomyces cynarae TaxID=2981134 RepID=UPI00406D2F58